MFSRYGFDVAGTPYPPSGSTPPLFLVFRPGLLAFCTGDPLVNSLELLLPQHYRLAS